MKKLKKDSIVVIDNKDVKINEVLPKVAVLSAKSILEYFKNLGLMFTRKLRMAALKEVITPYVNYQKPHINPLTDELRYRLRWYDTFSEAQLVNLLPVFEDGELLKDYKEELWLNILDYMVEKQVADENFNKLFSLNEDISKVAPLEVLDGIGYNNAINELFYDQENEIDGLVVSIFRPVVYKCSTLGEVREIGKKYGVDVPRRLRKQELVEIILDELKDKGALTPDIEAQVNSMTVIPLQRFAKNNDIKVSIELTKEEIIEYILKNAHQTKATYFKPQTDAYKVYDEEDFQIPDVEVIVMAEPEPVKVQVTLVIEEESTTIELNKGDQLERPSAPVKDNHEFVGWYLDNDKFDFDSKINQDLVLNARFNELVSNMVIVGFTAKGKRAELKIEKGTILSAPENPKKEGYEFIGWFLEDNLYDFEDPVFNDIELVAQWYELEPEKVMVTFIDEEDAVEVEVIKGLKVMPIEKGLKEDLDFAGWYLGEELYDFSLEVLEDITLMAKWIEKEPEVVYVSSTENLDLSEAIKEIRRIGNLVEELKDQVYHSSHPKADKLDGQIDFSEKYGFEEVAGSNGEIKKPIILAPYKVKVSLKSFKKLLQRRVEVIEEVKKVNKKDRPVPVIVVNQVKTKEEE